MSRPRLDCPPDVEAMLGVLADTEIGKRYGVPRQVVALWRRAAGKPPVPRAGRPPVPRPPRAAPKRHGRPRLACPDDVAPLLGVRPDDEVAARAGVSSATVRRWRTEREIEPCRERGRPRSAMTPPTTQRRLDALRARLGGLSWAHLAARLGVSRQAVSQARKLGASVAILRAWEQRAVASDVEHVGPLVYAMPDQVAPLLGILSDTEIGRRYGVPRLVVRRWRMAAGAAAAPRTDRPVAAPLSVDATRARLDALRAQHGGGTWVGLAARLGLRRQSLTSARTRGVMEATLARWESLPVQATESATP